MLGRHVGAAVISLFQQQERRRAGGLVGQPPGMLPGDQPVASSGHHQQRAANGAGPAGQALHIHVNTVGQRLERITRLLGQGWAEPERALEVHLALRVHQALGDTKRSRELAVAESLDGGKPPIAFTSAIRRSRRRFVDR